jgi:V8-like Glu-specific endopeptidase
MSSTGGYYHEGAVSLREGFINNRAKKLEIEGKVFKDINIYTLIVKPGSSGSAVFNVKGEVCGSINISFIRVDLSAGASYSDLNRFYLKLQKKIR